MKKVSVILCLLIVLSLFPSGYYLASLPVTADEPKDESTYYFDYFDEGEVWEDPHSMIDGELYSFAFTNEPTRVQLLNSNTYTTGGSGDILGVLIRAYGFVADVKDPQDVKLRPVFVGKDGDDHIFGLPPDVADWSGWYNITTDTNHPDPWTWNDVANLDCDVESAMVEGVEYCAKVELKVIYSEPPADTDPPTIVINFAGNPDDTGGPHVIPPGEVILPENLADDGYYTNDSRQHEDGICINLTVTDATGVGDVWFQLLNETTWTNWTYAFTNVGGNYWEINTSNNFSTASGYNYSFNIVANDTASPVNSNTTWWNKTGIGGGYTRRYVQLNCSQTNISYTIYYLYNATYTGIFKVDRLHHDQGQDGDIHDTGYLLDDVPTGTVSLRKCVSFTGYWFDESVCIQDITLDNFYVHTWWASDTNQLKIHWEKNRGYTGLGNDYDEFITSASLAVSNITYDNGDPSYSNSYHLCSRYIDATDIDFGDNDIYEFSILYLQESQYPSTISNRSFTSFIIPNVPDNIWDGTDNSTDTDGDGLSDHMELNSSYGTFTNPFVTDTDNDGVSDYGEYMSGSDPNNYTDTIPYNNPPTLAGEIPVNGSTGISLTPTCNVTANDADGGDTLTVRFYENTTSDDWLGISSAEYNSDSGYEGEHSPAKALDGDSYWQYFVVQVHWLILDLGQTYTIKKVQGRSDRDYDPTDVDIYVSDDKENWGDAVFTGADFSDTADWIEVDTTDKDGRYIKISIEGTEAGTPSVLTYGGSQTEPPWDTIFDAYGCPTKGWVLQQTNETVSPGTSVEWTYNNATEPLTKYWWAVNVSDGTDYVNETYHFTTRTAPIYANLTIQTLKDAYTDSDTYINITDPPESPEKFGWELLDNNTVFHMWNQYNDYYFNASNGVQFSNHYQELWTTNVLMLGYYAGDQWNLLYRTDELSNFNRQFDNQSEYINITLWKDLSYNDYDFRLALRYHLGVDDRDLTIIPYINNLGIAIPFDIGFGWEMKDIQINATPELDYININRTSYYLNQTLNNTYTNLSFPIYDNASNITGWTNPRFEICEDITNTTGKYLYLTWDRNLTYKVTVKSRVNQYNAPTTLFIRVGTLGVEQEKFTEMHWLDADTVTYYYNSHYAEVEWEINPGYMVDNILTNYAETEYDGQIELCNGNNCPGTNLGTITKVEIRAYGYVDDVQTEFLELDTQHGSGGDCAFEEEPDWGAYIDITAQKPSWSWADIVGLNVNARARMEIPPTVYCSKIEVRVTYGGAPPNNPPTLTGEIPANTSTDISYSKSGITINVTINDADGDSMNITFRTNESGSWADIGTNTSCNNGSYQQTYIGFDTRAVKYWWSANVTDGTDWTNETYSFTIGYTESKINNTGSYNITGYLLMQLEYNNSGTWQLEDIIVNYTTPITVVNNTELKLDAFWNGNCTIANNITSGSGHYRIYAAFRYANWSVIRCSDGSYINGSWEFNYTEVVNNLPELTSPSVAPTSGVASYTTFYFNITWADADGDDPSMGYLKVNITRIGWNTNQSMNWISGSNTTGAIYSYNTQLTAGSYNYTFFAYDGTDYNSSGPHDNPSVSAQSISFTISTSSETGDFEFMDWTLTLTGVGRTTEYNVSEDNQTESISALNITNTGNVPLNFYIMWLSDPGTGITMKWATSNTAPNPGDADIAISPSNTQIITNLAASETEEIFLWMDFVSVEAQTSNADVRFTSEIFSG